MGGTFSKKCLPVLKALSLVIDEVNWNLRLNRYNHGEHWPFFVTGFADCAPVHVQAPGRFLISRMLFQPKYKFTCFKLQLVVDFMGRIVHWNVMHIGVDHDKKIWERTKDDHE